MVQDIDIMQKVKFYAPEYYYYLEKYSLKKIEKTNFYLSIFTGFLTIEDSFKFQTNREEWIVNGYLPIAHCGFYGGLLVGIKENNRDKIFFENFSNSSYQVIANNIFDLLGIDQQITFNI